MHVVLLCERLVKRVTTIDDEVPPVKRGAALSVEGVSATRYRSLPREGVPKPGTKGRHTAVLAVCWDDREQGLKEKVCRPGYVMYTA